MTTSMDFSSLPPAELTDDGGKALVARLCVTAEIAPVVAEAVRQNWAVMPAGGLTSAIGSYDDSTEDAASAFAGVVAIRPKGGISAEITATFFAVLITFAIIQVYDSAFA